VKVALLFGMRKIQFICLMCSLAWVFTTVLADQTNPRLKDLFTQLKEVSSPNELVLIESKIWALWIETSDQTAGALLQTGINAMRSGDLLGALEAFDQVVAIAPDFAEGWNKRATAHYILGNYQQSLDDIAATLNLEPRHFGALSGRGLVYLDLSDLERALVAFEEALAVSPHMVGPSINAEIIRVILKGQEI